MRSDNPVLRWIDRQWLPATLALLLGGVPLWGLVLDSDPPMAILDARAVDPNVPRGGGLVLRYDIDRARVCPGEIQRIMIDGQGVMQLIERYEILEEQTPDAGSEAGLDEPSPQDNPAPPKIGRQTLNVSAPVPLGAAPGSARYQGIVHYYCNWVRRAPNMPVTVRTPVIYFIILDEVVRPAPPVRLPNAAPQPVRPTLPEVVPRRRSDLGPIIETVPAAFEPP